MNLIPKCHTDFSKGEYWEHFFRKRGEKEFEWYGEYGELCGVLHKYIKPSDSVLHVGCGNSRLAADLYDVGYYNIINIDTSEVAIRQMNDKNAEQRPHMSFIRMDALEMTFDNDHFSVVLDKGTLDAIFTDEKAETLATVTRYFEEINRVLRLGGRYLCISLAQEHILRHLLRHFTERGWIVRLCHIQQDDDSSDRMRLPVFAFILTKLKKIPNMKQILEMAYDEDHIRRLDTREQMEAAVKGLQQYSLVRRQLNQKNLTSEHFSLRLTDSTNGRVRYTLFLVDRPRQASKKFAIFIVPAGRETEWLFASEAGQRQLADSAGFERLVIALLHHDQTYTDLEAVKAELSGKVLELAPQDLGDDKQVPFLSVGTSLNQRTIRHDAESATSGRYVVEDVEVDGVTSRHLILLRRELYAHAVATIHTKAGRAKGGKRHRTTVVDHSSLARPHHRAMVAGLSLLHVDRIEQERPLKILILGLAGGSLAMFLHKHFSKFVVDVVEVDPEMVRVATEWFGFKPQSQLHAHVSDHLEFLKGQLEKGVLYDVIIVDLPCNDTNQDQEAPPPVFLQVFQSAIRAVLAPQGILQLHLLTAHTESVSQLLSASFQAVRRYRISDDNGELVYALMTSPTSDAGRDVHGCLSRLQGRAQTASHDSALDQITSQLEGLQCL